MSESKKINVNLQSESFDSSFASPISFKFNMNLGASTDTTNTDAEEQTEHIADSLFIKFNSPNEVPQDVKDYITNSLGAFDLVENGPEKTFIFELKIKDINIDDIRQMYKENIEGKAEDFGLDCEYKMSQTLDSLYQQLSEKFRVPLMLHLTHKAKAELNVGNQDKLLTAILSYAKSQNIPIADFAGHFIGMFSNVKGEVELATIDDFDEKMMEEVNWDQKENIKEVFGSLNNPINNFIFAEENAGQELVVSGRILNIVNYEFRACFNGLPSFLKKVEELN